MQPHVYKEIEYYKWPIVYRKEYNVRFFGLEKLHPFDAAKWGNIIEYLKLHGMINDQNIVIPNEVTKQELLVVHSKIYLKKLTCSLYVAQVAEVPALVVVPNCIVQRLYLKPMRYQTGGSILAGKLAIEKGWSINIGGGFHHCSAKSGGGFCPYADITLMVQFLFTYYPQIIKNVMIIDLDAHQGNGYQRDFKNDPKVYIIDVYNGSIYPRDQKAKESIALKMEVKSFIEDKAYLNKVDFCLSQGFKEFSPDFIVYNAGTDILEGDPLGCLRVSAEGVITRDEMVFKAARTKKVPITMLMSGGYLKNAANIIGKSIINLQEKGLIKGPTERY